MRSIKFLVDYNCTEKPGLGNWAVYSTHIVGAFNSTKMVDRSVLKADVWSIDNIHNPGDAEVVLQNAALRISEYAWSGPSNDDDTIYVTVGILKWDKNTSTLRVSFLATDVAPGIDGILEVQDVRDVKLLSA